MVDHNIVLRGLRGILTPIGDRAGITILQRTEQDFITAVLDELTAGIETIGRSLAKKRDASGTLQLFQPVHRTFHLAVLEVACDPFHHPALQPRLDPRKIESAGLVLRRYAIDDRGNSIPDQLEGWRHSKHPRSGQPRRGWISFSASDLERDPDPDRRPQLAANPPELMRRLSLLQRFSDPLAETTSPLFVAPPHICEATGRTLLYGIIPTTSSELSEPTDPDNTFDPAFIREHLPTYLRAAPRTKSLPQPEAELTAQTAADLDRLISDTDQETFETDSDFREERLLRDFIAMLRQLQFEFEAFSDRSDARELFAALNQIQLPHRNGSTRPAGTFLKQATQILVERAAGPVEMPSRWSEVSAAVGDRITTAVKAILDRRLALAQPQLRRFDELNRQYQVRAFIRVKREDGCPPDLIWSEPSPPFAIVPWYANSDMPPIQVALPDILDPATLRELKPSVAFAVPSNLFNALNGMNLQDLLDGKKPSGGGIVLDWICSFNIPIITLCAFIVLNIFLQLLNFIFQWLLFIKICIPIPR